MAATITTQPVDSSVIVDGVHQFSVEATGVGTLSYTWVVNGVVDVDATGSTYNLTATLNNSYTPISVTVLDSDDNIAVSSNVVLAITLTEAITSTRLGLVFNYDDNNFTWKDTVIEIQDPLNSKYKLYDIKYETYGFSPGWQRRWEDYKQGGRKESDWATTTEAWSDTYGASNSKEIIQVAKGDVYKADQVDNRQDSLKEFFVERTQMDLDDLNPAWTTNKIKQIKQFVFHMQSDMRFIDDQRENTVDFYVGWSNNLMDKPVWKDPVVIKLEDKASGGAYKVDYRTSGRYLSTRYVFTDSVQLAFTGGDIDANEVAGR